MTALIVVAKEPAPGRVKTRLCPPCTPEQAAGLAAAALGDTLAVIAAAPCAARVLALDGAPGPWIPDGFVIVPQRGNGLDERLANAFASVTGAALVVGMDTPQITPALIADAITTLHTPGVDAVLGPAADGGWWCLGLRRANADALVGVPMSTEHTGRAQLARLHELNLCTARLPELVDVDTFADARAVADLIPESRFAAAVASVST
jgi:rSAM/selenodomain-associated transferase 1